MKTDLDSIAKNIRKKIIRIVSDAKSCHIGSALSCVDILMALYFHTLNINPDKPNAENRDRFILSKGHAASALYAILAEKGFYQMDELKHYLKNGYYFTAHTNSNIPGVELSTGSLGHGLNVGAGLALAAKKDKKSYKTFVLISDGECDEGSVWEAILFASQFKLDNLVAIVDYNKIQSFGTVEEVMSLEPLHYKLKAFNWGSCEIDGHDISALCKTFDKLPFEKDKPNMIIAHTIKGKGVSFMENTIEWHYHTPTEEQTNAAIDELDKI